MPKIAVVNFKSDGMPHSHWVWGYPDGLGDRFLRQYVDGLIADLTHEKDIARTIVFKEAFDVDFEAIRNHS